MPFDHSNQTDVDRSIISNLLEQSDAALDACDRAACIEIIEQVYALLDIASAARVVVPGTRRGRTIRACSRRSA